MNREDVVPGVVLGNKNFTSPDYDILILGLDEAEKNAKYLNLGYSFPNIGNFYIENLLSSNFIVKDGRTAIITIFEESKRLTDSNYKKILKYLS